MSAEQERIVAAFRSVCAVFDSYSRVLERGTFAVLEFDGITLVLDENGHPTDPAVLA